MSDFICGLASMAGVDVDWCKGVVQGKKIDTPVGAACTSSPTGPIYVDADVQRPEIKEVKVPPLDIWDAEISYPPEVSEVQQECVDNDPSSSPQIAWLKSQLNPTGLVKRNRGVSDDFSYTYDQALAAIAFISAGEICEAQQVLQTLADLQNANGSWKTCYSVENSLPCEPYIHTGPIAWVVMAVNYYEAKTGDPQFNFMAGSALDWMDSMIVTSGEAQGALKFGEGYSQVSSEHNQDAYSAYYYRGQEGKAEAIKDFLMTEMWAPSPDSNGPHHNVSVFWRGFNDFAWCTDPQSWGVLALGSDYAGSLEWLDSDGFGYGSTKNTQQGVTGFSFCTEDVNPPNGMNPNFCGSLFVWLEGTESVAAAYYSIGNTEMGDYYHGQTAKVIAPNGGIPYTLSDLSVEWPCHWPYESLPSTAWYYFNEAKINPFKPF